MMISGTGWDDEDFEFGGNATTFDLTQMTLGMWKARSHSGLRFLLGRNRFVFVVVRRWRRPGTFSRASEMAYNIVKANVRLIRVPTSPFHLDQLHPPPLPRR